MQPPGTIEVSPWMHWAEMKKPSSRSMSQSISPPITLSPGTAKLVLCRRWARLRRPKRAFATAGDLTYSHIIFSENGGQSMEDAVIIMNAKGDMEGVGAEYYYLEKKFGRNGVDWNLISQSFVSDDAGRYYDKLDIPLSTGKMITMYFDITDFYGKGLLEGLDI